MRVTTSSSNGFGGRLGAGLVLLVVLVSLLVGARPSGAAVGTQEFPVATNAENETSVAVSGNTAVWSVSRDGGMDIQGKNLSTGAGLDLPSEPGGQVRPSVGGGTVVWEDTSSGDSNVYGYDLSTRQKFTVAVGPEDERSDQGRPFVGGNLVVWEDNRNGNWDVYGFDLDTGQEHAVTTAPGDQRNPVVGDGTVVWEQRDAIDSDVISKDLQTGQQKTIASGPSWQVSPAISDGTVVWREDRTPGNWDVYGYDLDEDREFEVAAGPGDQHSPAIGGRVAAWVDDSSGNSDVRGRDLSTGEAFLVAGGSAQQEDPASGGDTVLWEVQRTGESGFGTFDLYGSRLDLAPLAPSGLTASGSAAGVELDWAPSPEADLAGYNVYRADSENGSYTRLNTQGVISGASFDDPEAPLGGRSFYKITAIDVAGSESAAARASALALEPSEITLGSSAAVLTPGRTTTLSGLLTSDGAPLAARKVILEGRPAGAAAFSPVGELTTDAGGSFSLVGVRPAGNTDYRARFAGDPAQGLGPSESPLQRVDVKALVSASASRSRVALGKSLFISGVVLPVQSGSIKLTIKRGTTMVAAPTVRFSDSRYRIAYRPRAKGIYTVTATFAGDASYSGNTSLVRVFRVVR